MTKPSNLSMWVDFAEPGEAMTYHVGTHAHGDICREAMDLCEAGLIALVRKRRPDSSMFEYMAQRTKTKRKA
jgi:hypothetical protein